MKIEKLKLSNFRNISDCELLFEEGMNVISGENAQGKTNIIEAIWLFSGAKSFRNGKDSQFIKFGEEYGISEIEFISSGVRNNAVMKFGEKRSIYLNENKIRSQSEIAEVFKAIVFSPQDLSLITDGPNARRRYLDISISQIYPGYIDILRDYMRAVTQRNKIIKDLRYDSTLEIMLDVFEEEIANKGSEIYKYRKKYLELIKDNLQKIYEGISNGREEIMSVYVAKECDIVDLRTRLKEARKEDIFTGHTSIGPHRDDLDLLINGISARNYGSQGQKRSVALALKLSLAGVIKDMFGEYPVCLLDDVMSELDEARQGYILNHIKDWQSFITCCDEENVNRLKKGKVFKIKNGGLI